LSADRSAPSPTHFSVLDGVRGVGAVVVVAAHAIEAVRGLELFPHVQAGVDMFFALSGFVIAHAYQGRLSGGLRFGEYMKRRMLRLYPIMPLAVGLGAALYAVRSILRQRPDLLGAIFGSALLNALFLPSPLLSADADDVAWAVNTPLWSLTAELLVTVLFGCVFWRLSDRMLALGAALGAGGFAWLALRFGSTNIGQCWFELAATLVRPVYPFCVGVLLWRRGIGRRHALQLPSLLILGAMVAILLGPSTGHDLLAGLLAVWVAMPLVVQLAAFNARSASPLMRVLGEMSYPLYALHFPLVRSMHFVAKRWDLPATWPLGLIVSEVVVCCGVGYLAYRFYDVPVRRWLTRLLAARAPAGLKLSA
jgi:peptidoglycan/LPS O-acetylase OafA/YrhL